MAKATAEIIEKIRQAYVVGVETPDGRDYPSIEELSRQYKIPAITLFRRSSKENWKEQRVKFTEKLQQDIDHAKQKQLIKDNKDFDNNNLSIAKRLQDEIVSVLNLSEKKREEGEQKPMLNPSSLYSLGMALQTCQKVGRLALGETTENTSISNKSTVRETFELIDEIIRNGSNSKQKVH
tara:strand:- start:8890 stop:9429 length:540 start_codon:yes stop_codon:yes gene_type:complete